MKKKFLTLLGGALLGLFSMNVSAQNWEDVTSTYLINPDFEGTYSVKSGTGVSSDRAIYEPNGWTVSYVGNVNDITILNSEDKAANNFTSISALSAGGSNTYLYRGKWGNNTNITVTQSVALPNGKYRLSCDAWKSGLGGNGEIIAGSQTATLSENAAAWKSLSLSFEVTNGGTTQLGFKITHTSDGSEKFIGFDNFKLEIDNTVDKTNLSALITTAEDLYSASGNEAATFRTAIDEAQGVYDDDAATASEVAGAEGTLQAAIDAYKLANASASNPVDFTTQIGNIAGSTAGWTFTTGAQNRVYKTSTEKNTSEYVASGFIENWNPSAFTGKISYTITGLPAGSYRVSAFAFDSTKSGNVYFFAGNKEVALDNTTDKFSNPVITGAVVEENAGLEVGLNIKSSASNWVGIANIKVEYIGYDATAALEALAETVGAATYSDKHSAKSEEDLQTAIAAANLLINAGTATKDAIATASTNLSNAIAAVEASIDDYAALQAAIDAVNYTVVTPSDNENYIDIATAKATAQGVYDAGTVESCADAIAALNAAVKAAKVADYTYVTDNFQYGVELGEWITTGYVSNFSNEHWSGTAHQYKNQDDNNGRGWNSSTGFTIGLNQDVTLPAGKYVFKACGRKSAGATMTLTVKNGDDVLGSVSDFPVGSAARGINTSGATSFDEGNDAYANNGNGYGWQWRFVPFELTEEATINVAVSASATTGQQWASFGDYSVLTDNDANIAMIAYNIALNDAKLAIANDAYTSVTGAEKTELLALIAADMSGKTKAQIETATSDLTAATTAFTEAAPAYDAFASILAKVEDLDADGKASFNTAMAEVLAAYEANTCSASDLTDADAQSAFVAAIKAQGAGSDWTGLIVNPSFEDNSGTLPNGWTTERNTTGSWDYKLYEETLNTNGTTDGKYVLNAWAPQINKIYVKQSVMLPAGVYELSGAVYSDRVQDQHVEAIANGINYKSATVSNNTWETLSTEFIVSTESEVTIGIYSNGKNQSGNTDGWFRADNFKLKYVGPVSSANMKIYADVKWGTFVAPFAVAIPEGVEAYECTEVVDGVITTEFVEETAIPANTPVLVYSKTNVDETFYGKAVAIEGDPTCGVLVGTYADKAAPVGSYVLQKINDVFSFYKVVSGAQPTVGANRCYLSTSSSSTVLRFGGVTGIQSMEQQGESVIYDLTGRRVDAAVKGIYIVDGKKMLVK